MNDKKSHDDKPSDDVPAWVKAILEQNQLLLAQISKSNEKKEEFEPARRRLEGVIEAERERGPAIPEENVDVTSDVGGVMIDGKLHSATFVANIQRGRVIRLDNYKEPDLAYVHISDGGLCPLPKETMYPRGPTERSDQLNAWVYYTFYLPDNRHYCGRPLPMHHRNAAASATVASKSAAE